MVKYNHCLGHNNPSIHHVGTSLDDKQHDPILVAQHSRWWLRIMHPVDQIDTFDNDRRHAPILVGQHSRMFGRSVRPVVLIGIRKGDRRLRMGNCSSTPHVVSRKEWHSYRDGPSNLPRSESRTRRNSELRMSCSFSFGSFCFEQPPQPCSGNS